MNKKSLKTNFIKYCNRNKFELNKNQIKIIESLYFFYKKKQIFLKALFKPNVKLGFYLRGDVGVGKTMILNFFFNFLNISKKRMHFNEFMISFHDFRHKQKGNENLIEKFVKNYKKKYKLIYLDEFQVTNIVDAMILGKLFETIFKEKIKVFFSTNTKISDLYKDGLQREQFLPFIKIIKKYCIEEELIVKEDYRKSDLNNLERFFFINNDTVFKANRIFHNLTKGKSIKTIELLVKGRKLKIYNFFEGVVKFEFDYICTANLGAEDYLNIAKNCNFIFIENIPIFNDENLNKQQRFITFIDIIYEKKIPLMITSHFDIKNSVNESQLSNVFKRTLSRLHELTSLKLKF